MKKKKARKPKFESPKHAAIGRWTTLVGYFGLLTLIINWFTWIAPPQQVPRSLVLIALAVPLLFPLRGILHARRYTHQWVNFLALFYFAIGIDVWYSFVDSQKWLGMLMVLFSLLLFVGSVMYARFTPSEKRPEPELEPELEDTAAAPPAGKPAAHPPGQTPDSRSES